MEGFSTRGGLAGARWIWPNRVDFRAGRMQKNAGASGEQEKLQSLSSGAQMNRRTTLSRLTTHNLTSFCWKERKTTCRIKHFLQQNVRVECLHKTQDTFIRPLWPFLALSSPPAWELLPFGP